MTFKAERVVKVDAGGEGYELSAKEVERVVSGAQEDVEMRRLVVCLESASGVVRMNLRQACALVVKLWAEGTVVWAVTEVLVNERGKALARISDEAFGELEVVLMGVGHGTATEQRLSGLVLRWPVAPVRLAQPLQDQPAKVAYSEQDPRGVLVTAENLEEVLKAITVGDVDGGDIAIDGVPGARQDKVLALAPGQWVGRIVWEGQAPRRARLVDPRTPKARDPMRTQLVAPVPGRVYVEEAWSEDTWGLVALGYATVEQAQEAVRDGRVEGLGAGAYYRLRCDGETLATGFAPEEGPPVFVQKVEESGEWVNVQPEIGWVTKELATASAQRGAGLAAGQFYRLWCAGRTVASGFAPKEGGAVQLPGNCVRTVCHDGGARVCGAALFEHSSRKGWWQCGGEVGHSAILAPEVPWPYASAEQKERMERPRAVPCYAPSPEEAPPTGWCLKCLEHQPFTMKLLPPSKIKTAVCNECETPIADVTYAAERCQEPARAMTLVGAVKFLFGLLDDIDTMGDMAKSDDAGYRRGVERLQKRRWETGITTDGYELDLSGLGCTTAAAAVRVGLKPTDVVADLVHEEAKRGKVDTAKVLKAMAAYNEGPVPVMPPGPISFLSAAPQEVLLASAKAMYAFVKKSDPEEGSGIYEGWRAGVAWLLNTKPEGPRAVTLDEAPVGFEDWWEAQGLRLGPGKPTCKAVWVAGRQALEKELRQAKGPHPDLLTTKQAAMLLKVLTHDVQGEMRQLNCTQTTMATVLERMYVVVHRCTDANEARAPLVVSLEVLKKCLVRVGLVQSNCECGQDQVMCRACAHKAAQLHEELVGYKVTPPEDTECTPGALCVTPDCKARALVGSERCDTHHKGSEGDKARQRWLSAANAEHVAWKAELDAHGPRASHKRAFTAGAHWHHSMNCVPAVIAPYIPLYRGPNDDQMKQTVQAGPQPYCHAGQDGDCGWDEGCPQLRDGESAATGRHCPLDAPSCPDCDGHMKVWNDNLWHCAKESVCEGSLEPSEATKAAVAGERIRFNLKRFYAQDRPLMPKQEAPCGSCLDPSMPSGTCHVCGRKWGACAEAAGQTAGLKALPAPPTPLDLQLAAARGVWAALQTKDHLGKAVQTYAYEARTATGDAFEHAFEWAHNGQKDDREDVAQVKEALAATLKPFLFEPVRHESLYQSLRQVIEEFLVPRPSADYLKVESNSTEADVEQGILRMKLAIDPEKAPSWAIEAWERLKEAETLSVSTRTAGSMCSRAGCNALAQDYDPSNSVPPFCGPKCQDEAGW